MPEVIAAPVTTSVEPSITTGGGTQTVDTGLSSQQTQPVETKPTTEATKPDPFEFKFDGDEESYKEEIKDTPTETKDTPYDASKPLNNEIKELLKAKPELLKQIEKNHFELREINKAGFKTANEVKTFKNNVDSLAKSLGRSDGLKGIEAIKAEAGEWATTMTGLNSGDPAVVEQIFKDNPNGMSKLAGTYLNKLAAVNPAVFSHELSKIFLATLNTNDANGLNVIAAYNALATKFGDDPDASKLLNRLHAAFSLIYKSANEVPKDSAVEPTTLEARQKELDNREQNLYEKSVVSEGKVIIDSAIDQGIGKAFTKELKGDIREEVKMNILRGLQAALSQDDVYKNNAKDLITAKDTAGFNKALKAAIVRNLPAVLRKQSRIFGGIGDASTRKAEGQSRTESGAGPTTNANNEVRYAGKLVNGGISPSELDYTRMRKKFGSEKASEMIFSRKALLKGKGDTVYCW